MLVSRRHRPLPTTPSRSHHTTRTRRGRLSIAGALVATLGAALVAIPAAHAGASAPSERLSENTTGAAAAPVATFTQSPASPVKAGAQVTFNGSASTGDRLTYAWYFRGAPGLWDPNSDILPLGPNFPDSLKLTKLVGTDPILKSKFYGAGTLDVVLVVSDAAGQSASQLTTITIGNPIGEAKPPVATFTQSPPAPIYPGTKVTFDGSASTGNGLTYRWNVRGQEGAAGTSAKLDYTFRAAGSYGVELVVTDASGGSAKHWVNVNVTKPAPPVAAFSTPPTTVAPGTKVTFDGSVSTGDGLTYAWYVRGYDGVAGTDPRLDYTFRKPGTYAVQLNVTDAFNQTAIQRFTLVVASPPKPVATFTVPRPLNPGTKVTFDGSGSTGEGLTYAWHVRGKTGVVYDGPVLEYTFPKAGCYGVQLTVTDSTGQSATKWIEVWVLPANWWWPTPHYRR